MTSAAEFDSSGFSAVDKFFGDDAVNKDDQEKSKTSFPSSAAGNHSRGKRRGGVGATTTGQSSNRSSDVLGQQVLKVGRKRFRSGDHQGDDENGEDRYDNRHALDDDLDDEDGLDTGRTGIVKKSAPKKSKLATTDASHLQPPVTTNKKRKLGKRERSRVQQQQQQQQQQNQDLSQKGVATEVAPTSTNTVGDPFVVNITTDTTANTNKNPTKRKRRKVRSKQKNIRKDTRALNERPAHLIPGTSNYQGRPLTQATREKLHLPPSGKKNHVSHAGSRNKTACHRHQEQPTTAAAKDATTNNESPDDLFVIDRAPTSRAGDDVGVKFAIDEYMVEEK